MPRELEQHLFDYVVLGTGLTESILAASLSIAGASVLHLDSNPFYGSHDATSSVSALNEIISQNSDPKTTDTSNLPCTPSSQEPPAGSTKHALKSSQFRGVAFPHGVRLLHGDSHVLSESAERKVLLDLAPRTLLAAGKMVELMARTKVGHYVDFRALEATYVAFVDHGLRHVPASRSDVFQNHFITILEKRLLMRFVKNSLVEPTVSTSSASEEGPDSISFEHEMRLANLTEKLKTFLNFGVALSGADATAVAATDAREAVALYQRSLIRFATPTPFLYSNYGSSELSQAFCRLSAVHGGTYVLRRGVSSVFATSSVEGAEKPRIVRIVTDNGEHVDCKALVSTPSILKDIYVEGSPDDSRDGCIWRAMCVLDGSIVSGSSHRVLVVIPKGTLGNENAIVRLRQLDSAVGVCPPGNFVLYVETVGGEGSEMDVMSVLENYVRVGISNDDSQDVAELETEGRLPLTEDSQSKPNGHPAVEDSLPSSCEAKLKPRLLWGAVYSRAISKAPLLCPSKFNGLYLLSEGGAESDAAFSLETARLAFDCMLPDKIFFETKEKQQQDDEFNNQEPTEEDESGERKSSEKEDGGN